MSVQAKPVMDRIWANVAYSRDGCWLWRGWKTRGGYGSISVPAPEYVRKPVVHKIVYQMLVGTVPHGMQLDHLCRMPHCVNPAHLEIVTPQENMLRGNTVAAINAKKTHCPRGHAFTSDNIYWNAQRRHCATCKQARSREWSAKVSEARRLKRQGVLPSK